MFNLALDYAQTHTARSPRGRSLDRRRWRSGRRHASASAEGRPPPRHDRSCRRSSRGRGSELFEGSWCEGAAKAIAHRWSDVYGRSPICGAARVERHARPGRQCRSQPGVLHCEADTCAHCRRAHLLFVVRGISRSWPGLLDRHYIASAGPLGAIPWPAERRRCRTQASSTFRARQALPRLAGSVT